MHGRFKLQHGSMLLLPVHCVKVRFHHFYGQNFGMTTLPRQCVMVHSSGMHALPWKVSSQLPAACANSPARRTAHLHDVVACCSRHPYVRLGNFALKLCCGICELRCLPLGILHVSSSNTSCDRIAVLHAITRLLEMKASTAGRGFGTHQYGSVQQIKSEAMRGLQSRRRNQGGEGIYRHIVCRCAAVARQGRPGRAGVMTRAVHI